jgi:hypothetical protein
LSESGDVIQQTLCAAGFSLRGRQRAFSIKIHIASMVICPPLPLLETIYAQVINESENKKKINSDWLCSTKPAFFAFFVKERLRDILKNEETNPIGQAGIFRLILCCPL